MGQYRGTGRPIRMIVIVGPTAAGKTEMLSRLTEGVVRIDPKSFMLGHVLRGTLRKPADVFAFEGVSLDILTRETLGHMAAAGFFRLVTKGQVKHVDPPRMFIATADSGQFEGAEKINARKRPLPMGHSNDLLDRCSLTIELTSRQSEDFDPAGEQLMRMRPEKRRCPICLGMLSYHGGCGGRKVPVCEPCGTSFPRGKAGQDMIIVVHAKTGIVNGWF